MARLANPLLPLLALCALACSGESKTAEPPTVPTVTDTATEPADPAPTPAQRKLLLLGIDGATWKLIDPLLEKGRLPNFAKLLAGGSRAPLKTFEPCLSPLIWTTIATGVGPRKHGITGFTATVPATGEELLVTSNLRRVEALWNIASKAGRTVGSVGWWASFPAEEVNGFVISDQASTLRRENYRAALDLKRAGAEAPPRTTWPAELAEKHADALALSPKEANLERFMKLPPERAAALAGQAEVDKEDIVSIFKFGYLIDRSFVAAGLAAIGKEPPDLTLFYLNGLDAAEHHFWKYIEPERFAGVAQADVERFGGAIDEYYVYMDEVLGQLLARYPREETTVVIVSDHGHEANPEHDPKSKDHYDRVCSGGHEQAPDGVLIVSGKDVVKGASFGKQPNIFDVAPTVLALLGIPVGEDMPGRVLTEAFDPKFLERHPVSKVPTHSANREFSNLPIRSEMSDALKEKLKGIGYIQ